MATLSLKVLDSSGNTLAVASGEDFVDLVYCAAYAEGDMIELQTSEKNIHINWLVDDAMQAAFVYVTDTVKYDIPFGEARICCSPKVFSGNRHYMYAKVAEPEEVAAYRNLALNPADQHKDVPCYPHSSANVETRGESVFAAKNAIDGVRANLSHGEWPYGSWGINRREDATMKLEFGRKICTDRIVIYTRADFPHDNYWTEATVDFSDGTSEKLALSKTSAAQEFRFERHIIDSLLLHDLIKSDEPSPFPALTQIEVYGTVWNEQA
ncbi:MAG: carbohydrate-binding protein [Lachnospiraceae bacterium]|nr:carbohydrate-binding protein [Lachnospiraceae bacterium]